MDIIGYINTQEPVASWDAAKKQRMLDSLAEHFGYDQYTIGTKKEFVNSRIVRQIRTWVNEKRKTKAMLSATFEDAGI